jgi:hypothetical protein
VARCLHVGMDLAIFPIITLTISHYVIFTLLTIG